LFLQVFKSYYPLQQKCIICLLHNDRVLRQSLPSGKRINNYQSFTFMWPCIVTNFFIITAVPSRPCSKAVFTPVWHIPVPSVQWMKSWW
jgi:hypothetical protein